MLSKVECVICGKDTHYVLNGFKCTCSPGEFNCVLCGNVVAEEGHVCNNIFSCNTIVVKETVKQQDCGYNFKSYIRVTNTNNILPTEETVVKVILGKIVEGEPLEVIYKKSVYILDDNFNVVSKKRDFLVDGNREMVNDKMQLTVDRSFLDGVKYKKPFFTHVKGWLTWTADKVTFKHASHPFKKEHAKQVGIIFCKNGKVRAWIKCSDYGTRGFKETGFRTISFSSPKWTELFYGSAVYHLHENRRRFGTDITSYEWDIEALFDNKTEKEEINFKNKLGKAWAIHPILRELNIHIPEFFPGKNITSLGDYCELAFGQNSKGFRRLALSHRGKANLGFLKTVRAAHPDSGFEYWEKALNNPVDNHPTVRECHLVSLLTSAFNWDSGSKILWTDSYQGLKEIKNYCKVYRLVDPFAVPGQEILTAKELAKQALLKEVCAKLKTFKTIEGVHDYLSLTYLEKCMDGENQTPYHVSLEYTSPEISFRTPKTVGEVVLWGKKQHHCIANYAKSRDCILLQVEIPGQDVSHAQVQVIQYVKTDEKGVSETLVEVMVLQMFKASNRPVAAKQKALFIEHLTPIVKADSKYVTVDCR